MNTRFKFLLVLVLVAGLSACSSSQHGDDEEAGSDETIAQDAGTDAVPQENMEKLPDPDSAPPAESSGLDTLPTDEGKKAAAPESEASPSESAPVASSGETMDYTVQSGDTLMKIAFETYGDLHQWRKIFDMNHDRIPDANRLTKGTVLKVDRPASPVSIDRNGEKYLIKPGDTLGLISDDVYGTPKKWKKLYENNHQMIKDPNRIYAGFYLYYQMTDEDQRQKEEFLQKKGSAPLANLGAPAGGNQAAAVPIQAPDAGGLVDPAAAAGSAAPAPEARAPSAAPAK